MVSNLAKDGQSVEDHPHGVVVGVIMDIEGASALIYFEVINIVDDYNPLLGIGSATDMNGVINLKKWKMIFEKKSLRIIVPLDPIEGSHYMEPP